MGVRWEGVDEVLAGLDGVADRVSASTPDALEKGMEHIERLSVAMVPTLSTDLLDSRRLYATTKGGHPAHAFEYGTEYAIYEHYGHYDHDDGQRLFQEQAVRDGADEAVATVGRELNL